MSSFAVSTSGSERKNFQFAASVSRSGICSTILSAGFSAPGFDFGHWTTQSSQPMQSSGATWIVTFSPNFFVSAPASADLSVAGAPSSAAAG